MILITGGAGFIGSAVVRHIIENTNDSVVNVDCLTYAGNIESIATVSDNERYNFVQADICDAKAMADVFAKYQPDAVMHLAAESHVDRSIEGPAAFMQTNIMGTFTLLEAARSYWSALPEDKKSAFRFHHISTDEVYGDLEGTDDLFTEETSYEPSSPYSASKASSDHLVRAWNRTYGLPTIVTNGILVAAFPFRFLTFKPLIGKGIKKRIKAIGLFGALQHFKLLDFFTLRKVITVLKGT